MSQYLEPFLRRVQSENLNVIYAQVRTGGVVTEDYQAFPKKTRLNMMSVSKSVVSAGTGIALHEGLISLDESVCKAFKAYLPAVLSPQLEQLRVIHLLTMTSGLASALFFTDDPERYRVEDWISYFFHADFSDTPGTKFLYSNFNTYILNALIETRAGENMLEYLRHRLFEPLGIGNPDWTLCPKGHCYAANGLYLTIDEFGNFGQMLLEGGRYQGRQLVPAEYMAAATRKQVETKNRYPEGTPQSYGYGYQFWMTEIPDTFLCSGNYGQYCLVMPKRDTVICVMSLEGRNHKRIRDLLIETAKEWDPE